MDSLEYANKFLLSTHKYFFTYHFQNVVQNVASLHNVVLFL